MCAAVAALSEAISFEKPRALSGHELTIGHPTVRFVVDFVQFCQHSVVYEPVVTTQQNYDFVVVAKLIALYKFCNAPTR
jgi:hypothetical protein